MEVDPQTGEAEAAVCQMAVEVGVLRVAEEASTYDLNETMSQT